MNNSFLLCSFALAASLTLSGATISSSSASKTPPPFDADLYRKDAQVFSLHGEFLFWRVQEGALDYALAMTEPGWGPSNCYAEGHFKSATFDGDPGFRVAASFYRAPKYWEVKGQYTRLTAAGKNHAFKPQASNEYLTGTWPQIFLNPVGEATSYIHLNYNVADLWADRVFNPNPHLRLRLIGGGLAAWMDQFWKIKYADASGDETTIVNQWSFAGGGIKFGTMLDWYWFEDIYITGGVTFSSLLGVYHNKALQRTNFPIDAGTYNTDLALRNTYFRDIRPAFTGQFFVGPNYQKNFSNSRIELFAGYEVNAWLNLQEIYRSTSGTPQASKETWINTGMLALQGLTTRLTVDF
ncbi:MAG: hypothetical protein HY861_01200 [Chlamydiia bacterium]|nr:hypothetical protein [Chlamydiia bacterium]